MKKFVAAVAVVGALVLALGAVSFASADSPTGAGSGLAVGAMRGPGGSWGRGAGVDGPLHDGIVAGMADALGLDPSQVEQRLDAGETMWNIAESVGLSSEEFFAAMQQARAGAIEQAVAAGTISQAQADWMASRMGRGTPEGVPGNGAGICDGTAVGRGQRGGRWGA